MTALPVSDINFKQFLSASRGNTQWDRYIEELGTSRYENTYVATQEFIERLWIARSMGYIDWILGAYMDGIAYSLNTIDREIINAYSGNTKNAAQQDKVIEGLEALKRLSVSGTNYPEHFNDHGVDLNSSVARTQLLAVGLEHSEIDKLMRQKEMRQEILTQINGAADRKERGQSYGNESSNFTVIRLRGMEQWVWKDDISALPLRTQGMHFAMRQTGWMNLARPIPASQQTNTITLEVGGLYPADHIKSFFVFKGHHTVTAAKTAANGEIIFENIPAGTSGEIVTITYHLGEAMVSREAVSVDQNLHRKITLQASSAEALRDDAKFLDRM